MQPATQPTDPAQTTDPSFSIDQGVIRLPDGREINLADLQGGGASGVVVMRAVTGGPDSSVQVVDEQGRKISIQETGSEIIVTIKDGDKDPVEYRAADADQLKEKHPEAFELYEKYSRPDMMLAMPAGAAVMGDRFQFRVGAGNAGGWQAHGGGRGHAAVMNDTLGTSIAPVTDEFVKAQLGPGIMVLKVDKDSLGEKLGLVKNDLIKTVNSKPVETLQEFTEALESSDRVTIELVRATKPLTLEEK
jgi:hypothetical protein